MSNPQVKIEVSNGRNSFGGIIKYIRPAGECFNRSRKVSGYTGAEVNQKVENCIAKWYSPLVIYYEVGGVIIGSNSKENALKEYWRVCEKRDVNKIFEVKPPNNL